LHKAKQRSVVKAGFRGYNASVEIGFFVPGNLKKGGEYYG
jgi:hypothetical protein